jgi:hypothetical protein
MHTPIQIYDCAIFELAIRVFDIQSGWRDAYERQREYMRRHIFMGKSAQKSSVKDFKISTSIWITSQLRKQQGETKLARHIESHCKKMKSGP